MSDASREMQARFDAFAGEFLSPLLSGGSVLVSQPLSPGMLEHFAFARPSDADTDRAIFDALHAAASHVAPVRTIPWPDVGIAAVAMACHDLVAVTDPALDRWLARSSRDRMLGWVDFFVERAGPPRTRGAVLARHAIVSRVLLLRRADVVVKNWAYTYRFFGRPVPKRVVAMPRLRMVREEKSERDILDLWASLEDELSIEPRLRALVARSPLTEILSTDRFPDLRFGVALLAVLSDDLLRNGVARALVAQGDRVAKPLGRAIRQLAGSKPPERLLFYAIALAFEIHVIATLDAGGRAVPPFAGPEDDDAKLFAAILPAMLGAPDDLAALLELSPGDLSLLRHRAPVLDRAAGTDASREAVRLIDLALPPRLDHERDTHDRLAPLLTDEVGT